MLEGASASFDVLHALLARALCNLCTTKFCWKLLHGSWKVQGSTGACCVLALFGASLIRQSSIGRCILKSFECTLILGVLCASVVIQINVGTCFVQLLWYKVIWKLLCASFAALIPTCIFRSNIRMSPWPLP